MKRLLFLSLVGGTLLLGGCETTGGMYTEPVYSDYSVGYYDSGPWWGTYGYSGGWGNRWGNRWGGSFHR